MSVPSIRPNPFYPALHSLWERYLLPIGLPAVLAVLFGVVVGKLIGDGDWLFALPFILIAPLGAALARNPFTAFVLWMLVMPWFPFKGVYKYLYFTVHRLLIPAAVILVIVTQALKITRRRGARFGPAELSMAAFLALGMISLVASGHHWKMVFVLQDQFIVPFMAYALIRFWNAQEAELRRLIPLMLLIGVAECIVSLVSWFAPAALPVIWRSDLVGNRTMGTFAQPAAYGTVLILFALLVYHDAMNRSPGWRRTLQIMAFILALLCIFFTFTRGVWACGVVVVLGLLYVYPKVTGKLIAIGVPVLIVLASTVLAPEFAHAAARLQSSEEGGEARLVLANAGKQLFLARPIFGWGFGNYDQYDWKYMERVGETSPTEWQIKLGTSHHTYLTILAEMGLVGFLLYIFPLLWWGVFTWKKLLELPKEGFWSQRLLIVLWLSIATHVMLAQDIDMRFFYYCLTLFWASLGFVANLLEGPVETQEAGG